MLEEQIKPLTVSYHSLQKERPGSDNDVLTERWLHKFILITHIPAKWPAWKIAVFLLVMAGVVFYAWLPLGSIALTAATIYLGFGLIDWLLLSWLPQAGRSFGPVGPQLVVMTGPRVAVAVVLGLAAWVFGWGETRLPLLSGLTLLQLAGTATYLWGTLYEPFALAKSERTISSSQLPADKPPLRLLHLSDLHVERLTRREAYLMQLIEQAHPDLIVITGDFLNLSYVDDPVARDEVRKILLQLDAPCGVYATLGSPPVDRRETTPSLLEGTKIRLLRDEVAVLDFEDGRNLSLIGMDCDHNLKIENQIFQELVKLAPANSMKILLYHSPELMPRVQTYPIELYLCGHTHGGQIRLPFYGAVITSSALGKRYEMGPYVENDTMLYISRGIGLEGMSAPRMRLLCPPEIILFTLLGKRQG